jgi:hypothetical protein
VAFKPGRLREFWQALSLGFCHQSIHGVEQRIFGAQKTVIAIVTKSSQCVKVQASKAPNCFFVIETLLDQAAHRKVGGPFVLFSLNVKGTLSPKKSVTITISAIPCQTGSFTFSGHVPDNEKIPGDIFGSYNVQPVTVSWSCQLAAIKLNVTHTSYTWHVSDVQKLLQGDAGTADEIRKQAKDSIPANLHVGFIIVYGGAGSDSDIPTADQVSLRVSDILVAYGRNGGFVPLRDAVAYHEKLHTQQAGLNALGFVRVDIFSYNR